MQRFERLFWAVAFVVAVASFSQTVQASPFGQGVFGANVPFGSATSIAINFAGTVNIPLTANGSFFTGSASNAITVTSTDVVGYSLYIYAPTSSAFTSASGSIAASSNSTAGALQTNSWGYNTDGSSNFLGMTTKPVLLATASGPYKNGNTTTVTYGAKTDITTGAGSYSTNVVYTAVALAE